MEFEEPTLADLDRVVRAYERSHNTTKSLDTRETPDSIKVSQAQPKQPYQRPDAGKYADKKPCVGCGGKWHDKRSSCPNFEAICKFCKKKGHTEDLCFTKKNALAQQTDKTKPANKSKHAQAEARSANSKKTPTSEYKQKVTE